VNRLTQLTDNVGAVFGFNYDATNKFTSRTLPNNITSTYEYDGLDRLTRLRHVGSASTLADYQYQFNTSSQITQILEPTTTRNYAYDMVDRLTSATQTGQPSESYVYDSVGNRTASHRSACYSYQPFNKGKRCQQSLTS
jgi:YD repeat-containing protein